MLAKSISTLFPREGAGKLARWARGVTILVFITGLTALLLVVYDRYGTRFLDSANHLFSLSTIKPAAARAGDIPAGKTAVNPDADRYRVLAEFLAKRYRVSQDVTLDLVSIAHAAGQQLGLDPLLIMAVISVESRYNPIAESVAGAKGLMQIIPKYHADKLDEFGGEKAIFDPATNILVGSQILKEYLGRTGNLSMALQMYAGALNDDQDLYSSKVMGEKQRLQRVVGRSVKAKAIATRDATTQSSPL